MLPRETIEAFQRGEETAFAEVIRAYGYIVRAAARRFWSGVFDQEEAMQEVWLHIWKNRAAIDAGRPDELRGFIAVTARHRCVDLVRKVKPTFSLDDADEPSLDAPALDVARQREVAAAAAAFAGTLKSAWRSFFELHFVQGLPYEDVARKLGISKLRCKYMKKVIAARAKKDPALLAALAKTAGGTDAS